MVDKYSCSILTLLKRNILMFSSHHFLYPGPFSPFNYLLHSIRFHVQNKSELQILYNHIIKF